MGNAATSKEKKRTKSTPKSKRHVSLISTANLSVQPFVHQVEAAKFLLHQKRAILADEMGSGKTLSAILALASLKGKRLVVTPASLKLNWEKEIRAISPDPILLVDSHRKWKKPTRHTWVIMNYDLLHKHLPDLKKENFKGVCFDEAHFCKAINNNGYGGSKRARAFISLANMSEHVFLLTGTPITNKTKDIFNLLKALKHPLSRNFKAFAKRYCAPEFNGYGYTYDGSSNQSELYEKLQPYMLRRLKQDLLNLPPKMRSFIPVDISKNEYERKVEEYMEKRNSLSKKNEHLVYLNAMRHILAKEKVSHTVSFTQNLLDQGESIVVFTNYQYVIDALKEKFPQAMTITGKDSKEDRERSVEAFQSGKTNLILCNLLAGGVGVTLTKARVEIVNDFDYVPANHAQAEDRIHRIGQRDKSIIYYMYSDGTVDEKMANLLEEKLRNTNQIIDDKEEGFLDGVIGYFEPKSL